VTADRRESAFSVTRYLAIAALAVWALAAAGLGALAGGFPAMVAVLVVATGVFGGVAAVGVRFGERAVGVELLVAGGAWMLLFGIAALQWGLWPQASVFGPPGVVELGVDWRELSVHGVLAALGLIPLSVGVAFILGVGPLAKPVSQPEPKTGPSRRAALAVGVEALLVVAILAVAAVVVRTMLHEAPQYMSSVSNAPGP
jgi:hypothetical protein